MAVVRDAHPTQLIDLIILLIAYRQITAYISKAAILLSTGDDCLK